MPGTGPEVKTVTIAIAILPGLLFINLSQEGRQETRLAWEKGGGGIPAVLKVSQQYISLGSRSLQFPRSDWMAPP